MNVLSATLATHCQCAHKEWRFRMKLRPLVENRDQEYGIAEQFLQTRVHRKCRKLTAMYNVCFACPLFTTKTPVLPCRGHCGSLGGANAISCVTSLHGQEVQLLSVFFLTACRKRSQNSLTGVQIYFLFPGCVHKNGQWFMGWWSLQWCWSSGKNAIFQHDKKQCHVSGH